MESLLNKKVLMIANQFPPMGGSGVQRSSKFAKYLPAFGWEPIVLTRTCQTDLKDNTLLGDIPEQLKIIRTKAYDLTELKGPLGLLGKVIARKVLIPDGDVLWYRKSKKQALKIIKEHNIRMIYTTSYPYSDHLLGLFIKNQCPEVQWIADFRDEWTKNPYIIDMNYPSYRRKIEKKMEERVVSQCDYFITNTPLMLSNFLRSYPIQKKSYVIPNGYDEEDFRHLDKSINKSKVLTITYTGSMYGRRKPDNFLKAVSDLIHEGKINSSDLRIQFIGNISKDMKQSIQNKYQLGTSVSFLPYMEHKKSIEKLLESDILLFIIGAGKGAENFYSGKVFEYMNANRPILALVPKHGVAADVIRETNTGIIAETSDVREIKKAALHLYSEWKTDRLTINPDWDKIKRFERKALTKELSAIFDKAYQ